MGVTTGFVLTSYGMSAAGWIVVMSIIRLIGFFRQNTTLGPIAAMILHIIVGMIPLMLILVLLLLAGAFAMPLFTTGFNDPLVGEESITYENPYKAFQSVYMWTYGEFTW